jgi:acetyl esterase
VGWLDVVGKADLQDLRPVTIINAGVDASRFDGDILASNLRAAGVPAVQRRWARAAPALFGAAPLVADATEAQALAAKRLREALGTARTPMANPRLSKNPRV